MENHLKGEKAIKEAPLSSVSIFVHLFFFFFFNQHLFIFVCQTIITGQI